jgi:phosphatidate cytidylyltransferase
LNPALDPTPAPEPQPKKGPSNLRLRAIWGALAAALLFGCTFGGPISFGVFFVAVQAVILKEFYRIMRTAGYKPAAGIGIVAGCIIFGITAWGAYWMNGSTNVYLAGQPMHDLVSTQMRVEHIGLLAATTMVIVLITSVAVLLRELVQWPKHQQPFANMSIAIGGLFYVSIPMALLVLIAYGSGHYDPRRIFFLCFLIWAADTGAYFAGKNLGKHKLAPSISPGKTWEGWAGGALLTLAVGWAAGYFLPDISLGHRLVAAGVVAVFGPLGDLAESMLKRSAGVKDSGTFLPGHGGLLDRFDAFLLVLPVLALLQVLAG